MPRPTIGYSGPSNAVRPAESVSRAVTVASGSRTPEVLSARVTMRCVSSCFVGRWGRSPSPSDTKKSSGAMECSSTLRSPGFHVASVLMPSISAEAGAGAVSGAPAVAPASSSAPAAAPLCPE